MRKKIQTVAIGIECVPGAFGIARVPMPVPIKYQGSKQRFDVGASVAYPTGKGSRLRFRDGIFLRTDARFSDPFTTTATVAALAGGAILASKPASITMQLPTQVAEDVPESATVEQVTLWKVGDPFPGKIERDLPETPK